MIATMPTGGCDCLDNTATNHVCSSDTTSNIILVVDLFRRLPSVGDTIESLQELERVDLYHLEFEVPKVDPRDLFEDFLWSLHPIPREGLGAPMPRMTLRGRPRSTVRLQL